ncbi:hypothetical protein ND861_07370 [Leptospira sp. 2 VSF19]|uniref:Lipoprotein n=1 Tax=Leptospira soteropolitanensis TaxID=2950025 RepID=A0AAW5VI74_9LEPT|nr:hypothetical protein [Leptospira soteropolitanensis]MCW7492814.1 hypothetical protein [Leptospira soteropolitanensis]MCW7500049.1 hypothetical protein [Leptospira soteropolitanensis]MCW7522300.1 hypothetical protein [Leptospira soteropolitanensis]MCW7526156.1 hypothetical protein [Leptospira soteropolitanensis]MCW7529732.1 hypothetical protein [Leptospira soteropolitanensis]
MRFQDSKKLFLLLYITFLGCRLPINNPNTSLTISKKETYTSIKAISCLFDPFRSGLFTELGNDEDPSPDAHNETIYYEKRAESACLRSILAIPCPSYPINTTQATSEMVAHIAVNRSQNCTFKVARFFEFEKPLYGNF